MFSGDMTLNYINLGSTPSPVFPALLVATLMASFAEFERDLLRERIQSGIAAAHARGVKFGRCPGQRVKADKCASQVLHLGKRRSLLLFHC